MRKHPSLRAAFATGALSLLFAPDCTAPLEDPESDGGSGTGSGAAAGGGAEEPAGVLLAASRWTLAWDQSGVVALQDGGFELETDLGYRVRVTSGRILIHNLSFGLCDPGAASAGSEGAFWSLPVRSAHAHDQSDPSTLEASLIEDLLDPHETELAGSFPPARYCRAHWLLARPTSPTTGPADIAMANRSLVLTGTFERDGEAHDLAVDTWWPQGRLVDLEAAIAPEALAAARKDGRARHAFVTVTRHLGRLFDGIDFEATTDDQVAGLVIDNLVAGSEIHAELWSAGSSQ
jgi:hypothetical protein